MESKVEQLTKKCQDEVKIKLTEAEQKVIECEEQHAKTMKKVLKECERKIQEIKEAAQN